jgi:multidrug resistance efflux pump
MIAFLSLIYVAVLAVLVKIKLVPLNTFWKLSPLLWMLMLFIVLFMPMQWGAPSGTVNVYRDVIEIIPNVSGEVVEVPINGLQQVKKGDVLFQIDRRPFQAEVDRLEASLAKAEQNVPQLEAVYHAAAALTLETAARRDQAKLNNNRAENIKKANSGAVSQHNVELSRQTLRAAEASVRTAMANEQQAKLAWKSEIGGINTTVAEVTAQLAAAQLNLDWTTVVAPVDGYVIGATLQPGQRVGNLPISSIMALVNGERTHVIVGINQYVLRYVEPGQKAEVALKVLPGRIIGATVIAIAGDNPQAQLSPGGLVPEAPSAQTPIAPYGVVLALDEDIPELQPLRGGAVGSAAIYTGSVQATHMIRRVMMRMQAWLNYIVPT